VGGGATGHKRHRVGEARTCRGRARITPWNAATESMIWSYPVTATRRWEEETVRVTSEGRSSLATLHSAFASAWSATMSAASLEAEAERLHDAATKLREDAAAEKEA